MSFLLFFLVLIFLNPCIFVFCIFVSENSAFVCIWTSSKHIHAYPVVCISVVAYGHHRRIMGCNRITTTSQQIPETVNGRHLSSYEPRCSNTSSSQNGWEIKWLTYILVAQNVNLYRVAELGTLKWICSLLKRLFSKDELTGCSFAWLYWRALKRC